MIDGTTAIILPANVSFRAGDTVQLGIPTSGDKPEDAADGNGFITRVYPNRVAVVVLPAHNTDDHSDSPDCWCCPVHQVSGGAEVTPEQGRALWKEGKPVIVIHRSEIAGENVTTSPIPWMTGSAE